MPNPNSLEWKLMLAATALLKDKKGTTTPAEKARWANLFKFIVDHDRPRALALLSRLVALAEEDPKPQITTNHLYILAGNTLELVPTPQQTITSGVDVQRIETVSHIKRVTPLPADKLSVMNAES